MTYPQYSHAHEKRNVRGTKTTGGSSVWELLVRAPEIAQYNTLSRFSDDPILLQRIFACLSSRDQTTILDIRKQLDDFHKKGMIKFTPVTERHSKYILDRLAFQLTFLGASAQLEQIKLQFFDSVMEISPKLSDEKGAVTSPRAFEFNVAISQKVYQDPKELDLTVSHELYHIAQQYVRDTKGFTNKACRTFLHITSADVYEAAAYLQEDLFALISTGKIEENSPARKEHGLEDEVIWAVKEKLFGWVQSGAIDVEHLHDYFRAMLIALNSIDISHYFSTDEAALYALHELCISLSAGIRNPSLDMQSVWSLNSILVAHGNLDINDIVYDETAKALEMHGIPIKRLRDWRIKVINLDWFAYLRNSEPTNVDVRALVNELNAIIADLQKASQVPQHKITSSLCNEVQILLNASPTELLARANETTPIQV